MVDVGLRRHSIDEKRWPSVEHDTLGTFLGRTGHVDGMHVVGQGPNRLYVGIRNRGFDTTVVFLHEAARKETTLPVTGGEGITVDLPVNQIFFTDPSIGVSQRVISGWFLGDGAINVQALIPSLIDSVTRSWGRQRIIFFGASSGGFASLVASASVPGSQAVVINPQTSLACYYDQPVSDYIGTCFDQRAFGLSAPAAVDFVPEDRLTDACELYRSPVPSQVLYLQNSLDAYHVSRHHQPFTAACHVENAVTHVVGDWGPGHVPPPKPVMREALLRLATTGDVDHAAEGVE